MAFTDVIREKVFRFKMSLPGALQVRMAGGQPIVVRGRTMDPSLQLLAHMSAGQPTLDSYPIDIARAASAAGYAAFSGPANESVSVRDTVISNDGSDLPIRIYTPRGSSSPMPVVVFFHPGGWVIGDLESGHRFCTELCNRSCAVVVSVNYRLAPEHVFPAAVEDALFAYKWAIEHAAELGGDAGGIWVAGESAGANLAAVVCLLARDEGLAQPSGQILISPVTDVQSRHASYDDLSDAFPLTAELMEWFISHYIASEEYAGDFRASPLLAKNLEGLAPALIVTAGFDPLLDEGEAYARRLAEAGVEVRYHCENGAGHGIATMLGVSRSCWAAGDRVLEQAVQLIKNAAVS